jgi:hypothetical protein
MTTLAPPRLENRTTSSCAHPMAKPVLSRAATVVRLKCTLHDDLRGFDATRSNSQGFRTERNSAVLTLNVFQLYGRGP